MDGMTFGPYTALEIRNLDLLDDILVTEESMNGQWLPASRFDFDDMVQKEFDSHLDYADNLANEINQTLNNPNPYTQPAYGQPTQPFVQQQAYYDQQQSPYQQSYQQPFNPEPESNDEAPKGLCVLAFFIPLVGWILYFVFRDSQPKKASAICKCAWIGFAVGVALDVTFTIIGALFS